MAHKQLTGFLSTVLSLLLAVVALAQVGREPQIPGNIAFQSQGNLPMTEDAKVAIRLNTPSVTPQVIFPNRKIGALEEGYEASFLALDADPLATWTATKQIRMRFKQGLLMNPIPQ